MLSTQPTDTRTPHFTKSHSNNEEHERITHYAQPQSYVHPKQHLICVSGLVSWYLNSAAAAALELPHSDSNWTNHHTVHTSDTICDMEFWPRKHAASECFHVIEMSSCGLLFHIQQISCHHRHHSIRTEVSKPTHFRVNDDAEDLTNDRTGWYYNNSHHVPTPTRGYQIISVIGVEERVRGQRIVISVKSATRPLRHSFQSKHACSVITSQETIHFTKRASLTFCLHQL